MKRTLLAVGVAVLTSMMLIPQRITPREWRPFFFSHGFGHLEIDWQQFALQTVFAAVAAAVIVNLFPRRPRK